MLAADLNKQKQKNHTFYLFCIAFSRVKKCLFKKFFLIILWRMKITSLHLAVTDLSCSEKDSSFLEA